jgi:hypothetical protein
VRTKSETQAKGKAPAPHPALPSNSNPINTICTRPIALDTPILPPLVFTSESSDGIASVGTILPKTKKPPVSGGFFVCSQQLFRFYLYRSFAPDSCASRFAPQLSPEINFPLQISKLRH